MVNPNITVILYLALILSSITTCIAKPKLLTMPTTVTLLVWLFFIKDIHTCRSFDWASAVVEWTWISGQRAAGSICSGERCTPQCFLQIIWWIKQASSCYFLNALIKATQALDGSWRWDSISFFLLHSMSWNSRYCTGEFRKELVVYLL